MKENSLLKYHMSKTVKNKIESMKLARDTYKSNWFYGDEIPFEIKGVKVG